MLYLLFGQRKLLDYQAVSSLKWTNKAILSQKLMELTIGKNVNLSNSLAEMKTFLILIKLSGLFKGKPESDWSKRTKSVFTAI